MALAVSLLAVRLTQLIVQLFVAPKHKHQHPPAYFKRAERLNNYNF